jgi:endonuclease/exonuclease/phosphatase (EEP) superfamily protein YafD
MLGITLAVFLPRLAPRVALCVTLESFAPQLLLASVVTTVLALCCRPRSLAVLGCAGIAWNLMQLWPYLPVGPIPSPPFLRSAPPEEAASGPRLKVISANVWYRNEDYQAAVNYLTAADADVVGLLEVTPNWRAALAPLYDRYPYRLDCTAILPPCEIMLLSKVPFTRSGMGPVEGRSPSVAWAEIQLAGRPLIVLETHFAWPLLPASDNGGAATAGMLVDPPLPGTAPLLQSQQASALSRFLAGLGKDVVVMGDFNSVPWSMTQVGLRRAANLRDPGPAVPTWPSWQPAWSRLPIDHILVGGDLVRRDFRHGNYINSDHLPVAAEIGWRAE